jgi:hypothetical protein
LRATRRARVPPAGLSLFLFTRGGTEPRGVWAPGPTTPARRTPWAGAVSAGGEYFSEAGAIQPVAGDLAQSGPVNVRSTGPLDLLSPGLHTPPACPERSRRAASDACLGRVRLAEQPVVSLLQGTTATQATSCRTSEWSGGTKYGHCSLDLHTIGFEVPIGPSRTHLELLGPTESHWQDRGK